MQLGENLIDNGSRTYAKQIHVYGSNVYAEIIYQDKETEYDHLLKLWYLTMSKTFGSAFRGSPREKDYIKAHKWADEQLELLNKYGTKKLSKEHNLLMGK